MINKFKNFLCIFAHPDDEVLSAGGTINKLIQNKKNIYIGIPGTGIYSRNKIRLMEFRLQRGIRTPEQIIADIPKGDADYQIRHNGRFNPKEATPEATQEGTPEGTPEAKSTLYPPKPSFSL